MERIEVRPDAERPEVLFIGIFIVCRTAVRPEFERNSTSPRTTVKVCGVVIKGVDRDKWITISALTGILDLLLHKCLRVKK